MLIQDISVKNMMATTSSKHPRKMTSQTHINQPSFSADFKFISPSSSRDSSSKSEVGNRSLCPALDDSLKSPKTTFAHLRSVRKCRNVEWGRNEFCPRTVCSFSRWLTNCMGSLPSFILTLFLVLHAVSEQPVAANIHSSLSSRKTMDILSSQAQIPVAEVELKNQECNMTRICLEPDLNVSPICGTDGRTYNSMCEIKRAACHGNPVTQHYKGPCPDKAKCNLERKFSTELSKRHNQSSFIPECEADGSYSPVQCHKTTGFCWCMSSNGRPIPGTAVHFKRPDCLPQGKVGRRSSRRMLGMQNRGCTTIDRTHFTNSLKRMFTTEFDRQERLLQNQARTKLLRTQRANSEGRLIKSPEQRIIDWKFGLLDVNKDGRLSQKELRSLRRLVKKVVSPRACAKEFTTFCDHNKDRRIGRNEWSVCLGVDINTSVGTFMLLNTNHRNSSEASGGGARLTAFGSNSASSAVDPGGNFVAAVGRRRQNRPQADGSSAPSLQTDRLSPNSLLVASAGAAGGGRRGDSSMGLLSANSYSQSTARPIEDENLDCKSQRTKALKAAKTQVGTYIPECVGPHSPLFAKVQCHKSAGFCWCADDVTGRPIAGSSAPFSERGLDCQRRQRPTRPRVEIKKCPETKRQKFIRTLHARLESNMIASSNAKVEMDTTMAQTELAARWKFSQLDANKNGRLERKEWKGFRGELKVMPGIRRCGRNFLQFCAGEDRKISLDEWLYCTLDVDTGQSSKPKQPGRGPNPFEHVLKPDQ